MDDTVKKSKRETKLFLNSTRTVTRTLPALLGSSVKWTGTFCSVITTPAFGVHRALGEGQREINSSHGFHQANQQISVHYHTTAGQVEHPGNLRLFKSCTSSRNIFSSYGKRPKFQLTFFTLQAH